MKYYLLLIFIFASNWIYSSIPYKVEFTGYEDSEIGNLLKSNSQLIRMSQDHPETKLALRRRADEDIANLIQCLHSLAYYGARVEPSFNFESSPAIIFFNIHLGPIYSLGSIQTIPPIDKLESIPLGISAGSPAYPKSILAAEEALERYLVSTGHPLARVAKKEIVVDQASKNVHVTFHISAYAQAKFGKTAIVGADSVQETFINQKIEWKEGALYDPAKVKATLDSLESSGLFTSIMIKNGEQISPDGSIPMIIEVEEGKHRSIGFGLSYATQQGPGLTAEWEHRNFRGMGERVSIKSNFSKVLQEASLLYVVPDFLQLRQDFLGLLEAKHEITDGYTETSYAISGILDRELSNKSRFSYGLMFKSTKAAHSNNNRQYDLLKLPLQYRFYKTNDLLDPSRGFSVNLKCAPTLQLRSPSFAYAVNTLTLTGYHPLDKNERFVLAGKCSFGSILGPSNRIIPPSERFYAGNDNMLRGYRYMTVSPLDHNKPIGGRSLMVLSSELRFRATEKLGWAAFYEIGNVYEGQYPEITGKQLQSVGIGVRYLTPVGPLRLDLAFPLNRREHIDDPYQIYFSIGQAF